MPETTTIFLSTGEYYLQVCSDKGCKYNLFGPKETVLNIANTMADSVHEDKKKRAFDKYELAIKAPKIKLGRSLEDIVNLLPWYLLDARPKADGQISECLDSFCRSVDDAKFQLRSEFRETLAENSDKKFAYQQEIKKSSELEGALAELFQSFRPDGQADGL